MAAFSLLPLPERGVLGTLEHVGKMLMAVLGYLRPRHSQPGIQSIRNTLAARLGNGQENRGPDQSPHPRAFLDGVVRSLCEDGTGSLLSARRRRCY